MGGGAGLVVEHAPGGAGGGGDEPNRPEPLLRVLPAHAVGEDLHPPCPGDPLQPGVLALVAEAVRDGELDSHRLREARLVHDGEGVNQVMQVGQEGGAPASDPIRLIGANAHHSGCPFP